MERAEVRLECLKLAVRRDWKINECIEAAKQLEDYVLGEPAVELDSTKKVSSGPVISPKQIQKKNGNPDPLS